MYKAKFRYFVTRLALAVLLTLCIMFFIISVNSHHVVSTSHSDVSTSDPKVAEKAYWEFIYDYRKVKVHSKHYYFGRLLGETWRYMDGREVTSGFTELDLWILEITVSLLIFVLFFALVPTVLRKPKEAETESSG